MLVHFVGIHVLDDFVNTIISENTVSDNNLAIVSM